VERRRRPLLGEDCIVDIEAEYMKGERERTIFWGGWKRVHTIDSISIILSPTSNSTLILPLSSTLNSKHYAKLSFRIHHIQESNSQYPKNTHHQLPSLPLPFYNSQPIISPRQPQTRIISLNTQTTDFSYLS